MADPRSNSRREWLAVALLTLLGLGLRLSGSHRLGLTHFDEGVYALAGTWSQRPGGLTAYDPSTVSYAPPVFPILVGLSYLFFGVDDLSAILVSQVAGAATIPAVAWVGRRTFGPGAGVASAALAAFSGPHVAFSRMALTDSCFLLTWVAALGLGGRFAESPGPGLAVAFGLSVGLAQNVKYNGWLTGVIVAVAALLGPILSRGKGRPGWLPLLGYGTAAAVLAFLVYLPWFSFVDRQGGYSALLAHHRSYLGGIGTWLPNWRAQMAQATSLAGIGLGRLSWGFFATTLAVLGVWWACGRRPGPRVAAVPALVVVGAASILLGVSPNSPWWVALGTTPWLIAAPSPARRVVGLAWLVPAILTPLYYPYARLWLPLTLSGWLVLGGIVAEVLRAERARSWLRIQPWSRGEDRSNEGAIRRSPPTECTTDLAPRSREWRAWSTLAAAALGVCLDLSWWSRARPLPGVLGRSDSVRASCARFAAKMRDPRSPQLRGIRTFAQPPVLFYLAQGLNVLPEREAGLGFLLRPATPGEYAVLDSALLDTMGLSADVVRRTRLSWVPLDAASVVELVLPLPSRLDLQPGVAFGEAPRPVFLELLVPRRPPTDRSQPRGSIAPRGGPH